MRTRAARLLVWLLVIALAPAVPPTECGTFGSVEVGGGDSVGVWGVGFGWDDLYTWNLGPHFQAVQNLLLRIDHWHGTQAEAVVANLWDLSATPVLRLQPATNTFPRVFLDIGLGVHLITEPRINRTRQFSTVFQFGEFLGPGVQFGDRGQYELSFRLQHVSNGRIEEPNDGLNYGTLVFQYHFR